MSAADVIREVMARYSEARAAAVAAGNFDEAAFHAWFSAQVGADVRSTKHAHQIAVVYESELIVPSGHEIRRMRDAGGAA